MPKLLANKVDTLSVNHPVEHVAMFQVTPSSFTAKDALTSHGAQLVVRERPSTVVVQRVGYNGGDQVS